MNKAPKISSAGRVGGTAWIGDRADVTRTDHYLTIGPIGSTDRTITCYRTRELDGSVAHRVIAGCWSGTLSELEERVNGDVWPDHWRDPSDHSKRAPDAELWRAQYLAAIALMRVSAHRWAAEQ